MKDLDAVPLSCPAAEFAAEIGRQNEVGSGLAAEIGGTATALLFIGMAGRARRGPLLASRGNKADPMARRLARPRVPVNRVAPPPSARCGRQRPCRERGSGR